MKSMDYSISNVIDNVLKVWNTVCWTPKVVNMPMFLLYVDRFLIYYNIMNGIHNFEIVLYIWLLYILYILMIYTTDFLCSASYYGYTDIMDQKNLYDRNHMSKNKHLFLFVKLIKRVMSSFINGGN